MSRASVDHLAIVEFLEILTFNLFEGEAWAFMAQDFALSFTRSSDGLKSIRSEILRQLLFSSSV